MWGRTAQCTGFPRTPLPVATITFFSVRFRVRTSLQTPPIRSVWVSVANGAPTFPCRTTSSNVPAGMPAALTWPFQVPRYEAGTIPVDGLADGSPVVPSPGCDALPPDGCPATLSPSLPPGSRSKTKPTPRATTASAPATARATVQLSRRPGPPSDRSLAADRLTDSRPPASFPALGALGTAVRSYASDDSRGPGTADCRPDVGPPPAAGPPPPNDGSGGPKTPATGDTDAEDA
mgnify:CR=1 FL=1